MEVKRIFDIGLFSFSTSQINHCKSPSELLNMHMHLPFICFFKVQNEYCAKTCATVVDTRCTSKFKWGISSRMILTIYVCTA